MNTPLPNVLTPDIILGILNEFAALDPEAAHALTETRVPVNDAVAAHDTLMTSGEGHPSGQTIGILGLFNGVFGLVGLRLYGHYNEAGKLESFSLNDPFVPPVP